MSEELLREYIKELNFINTNDILMALKDMLRDLLQKFLEVKMDQTLVYDKCKMVLNSKKLTNI